MRAARKKIRAWFFLAKPGLSEFHKISMKTPVAQCSAYRTSALKVESSNPGRSGNTSICQYWKHSKHVRIKQFFGAWKIVFPQSLSFLQVIGENNASGPHVYPHIDFARVGSSPSMCGKKQFFGAWKIVFLQSPISSHKTIRGHATKKNERQRGIANLTYTQ